MADNSPTKPRELTRRRSPFVILSVALVILVGGGLVFASSANAQDAVVQRVVDGDTVDVRTDGETQRVRLLNIDTPETKDPNRPVECMGEEATAFTKTLLEPGDEVQLEFDDERTDRFGRTLAHIKLSDGRYVSDEIARQGLGDAVVFGRNDKRFEEVRAALVEASDSGSGLFSSDQDCTVPTLTALASEQLAAAKAVRAGSSIPEALAAAAAVAALGESVDAAWEAGKTTNRLAVAVFKTVGRDAIVSSVDSATTSIEKIATSHEQRAATIEREEAADVARMEAEAELRRLTQEAEADRNAREAAPEGGSSSNPYPGYNGPRCYAPGGKTWKPC